MYRCPLPGIDWSLTYAICYHRHSASSHLNACFFRSPRSISLRLQSGWEVHGFKPWHYHVAVHSGSIFQFSHFKAGIIVVGLLRLCSAKVVSTTVGQSTVISHGMVWWHSVSDSNAVITSVIVLTYFDILHTRVQLQIISRRRARWSSSSLVGFCSR